MDFSQRASRKLQTYILSNDSWMFLAVFLVLAAERTISWAPHNWLHYGACLLSLVFWYAPLLIFVYFKSDLKKRYGDWRYIMLWVFVFVCWSTLVAYLVQEHWAYTSSLFEASEFFLGLGVGLAVLDIVIEANRFWKREDRLSRWFKKLGINRAILLTILLFSMLISMMTVSNLEVFYTDEIIVPDISLPEVFRHFFLFLLYALQFFTIYVVLYFFYWWNDKILIRYLLKKRGVLIYIIGGTGSIALFFPLLAQLIVWLPLVRQTPSLMPQQRLLVFTELNAMIPFVVTICSLPIIVALQWFRQNHDISQLEKQQVEQELHLLKQQINPHFFFNTLNNLYSLSLNKSDEGPEVIVRLSELMRYVIYKGKEKEVTIGEEIAYLQDYIALQQIRLHKKLDLHFDIRKTDDSIKIPPLLLIILVENAFKHGIEPAEKAAFLRMDLQCDQQQLIFRCENSFEPPLPEHKGIGLDNLSRRLNLLFPDRHRLTTEIQDQTFIANLILWI